MALFGKKARVRPIPTNRNRVHLAVEGLESRLNPYALSGNAWIRPDLITISFVPDGTVLGTDGNGNNITSNLQGSFTAKFGNAATWQNQILKAAQQWAQQTNINFKVVGDNGAATGSGNYQQGDSNFGDIRIGGYNFGTTTLAQAYSPPPDNGTSYAGDIQFNTGQTWNIGSTYDLYTVSLHEFGHALGLLHGASGSAMYGSYSSVLSALQSDDINGARAVTGWTYGTFSSPGYGGARANDSYDATSNGTFATASTITSTINTTTKTALLSNLDISTTSDVDYYKFVVPTGLGGTLTIKAQSDGLSLLAPTLKLYNNAQTQLATQSTSTSDFDGTTLTVSYNVTAGQTYYVRVAGLNTTAHGTGRYALALGFAGVAAPVAASPNTQTANDPNSNTGGGEAVGLGPEQRVNTYTAGSQTTSVYTPRAVAMDKTGRSVVVWTSDGQDGDSTGIYAQRFDAAGNKLGSEFRVNTTTLGRQHYPSVAMDDNGNFVVVWTTGYDYQEKNVFGQRYNASGVAQGSEFQINTGSIGGSYNPVIAMNPSGSFVVAWEAGEDYGGYTSGIKIQRFDASGTRLGSEVFANTTTAQNQCRPSIDIDNSGNFVVVWDSYGQDGSEEGVFGQLFNSSGVKVGGGFQINQYTSGAQYFADVGMDSHGNFVVAWVSNLQDGSEEGVYARRYNASGVSLGNEFRVNTTTEYKQWHPSVAMAAGGTFFITWDSYGQDNSIDGLCGVFGQQYSSSGVRQGQEFRINTTSVGEQRASSMALNMNGDAVIVWGGNGSGDTDGIFMQRYMVSYGGMNPMHGFGPDRHDDEHEHQGTTPRPRAHSNTPRLANYFNHLQKRREPHGR